MNTLQEPLAAPFPPPCPSGPNRTDPPTSKANHNPNVNPAALDPLRCEFTSSDGRQCRMQRAHFCAHHSSKEKTDRGSPDAALGGLEALCGDLTTATNINRALSQTFLLMAQGRIAQKQAVAFGYLAQLLLQTVPGIRSEFVSAFGYSPWEANLKSKLSPQPHAPSVVILSESASGGERRISPPPSPEREISPTSPHDEPEPSPSASSTPPHEPDYASLLSRSRDLFDGKYDATPEGRREANALVAELELMKPPASKPPRGLRARAIELVKRLRAQKPPAAKTPPTAAANRSPRPIAPAAPSPAAPSELPPTRPGIPQSEDAPPSLNPGNNRGFPTVVQAAIPETLARFTVTNEPPSPTPTPAPPVPGITLTRTGHTTDWYAPASWSNPSQPGLFPSRKEKLARKLRGMSNYRLRHLQHLNSRGL